MLLVYENKEILFLIGETKGLLLISFNYEVDFNLQLLVKLVDREYFNIFDTEDSS